MIADDNQNINVMRVNQRRVSEEFDNDIKPIQKSKSHRDKKTKKSKETKHTKEQKKKISIVECSHYISPVENGYEEAKESSLMEKNITLEAGDMVIVEIPEDKKIGYTFGDEIRAKENEVVITYSYSIETHTEDLREIEVDLKGSMFQSIALDVCLNSSRRLFHPANRSNGIRRRLAVAQVLTSETDRKSGSCKPELDPENICTIYNGEIVAELNGLEPNVNSEEIETEIVKFLTTYATMGKYESVDGVLALRMLEDAMGGELAEARMTGGLEGSEDKGSVGVIAGMTAALAVLSALIYASVNARNRKHVQLGEARIQAQPSQKTNEDFDDIPVATAIRVN